MKYLLSVVLGLTLAGCSVINLFPKKHDPVEVMYLVETKVAMDALTCGNDAGWESTILSAVKLATYADYRNEAQLENVHSIKDNLVKAKDSKATCQLLVNVAKSRVDILVDAWRIRS